MVVRSGFLIFVILRNYCAISGNIRQFCPMLRNNIPFKPLSFRKFEIKYLVKETRLFNSAKSVWSVMRVI